MGQDGILRAGFQPALGACVRAVPGGVPTRRTQRVPLSNLPHNFGLIPVPGKTKWHWAFLPAASRLIRTLASGCAFWNGTAWVTTFSKIFLPLFFSDLQAARQFLTPAPTPLACYREIGKGSCAPPRGPNSFLAGQQALHLRW